MADEKYLELREEFQIEQKAWDQAQKGKPNIDQLTGQVKST